MNVRKTDLAKALGVNRATITRAAQAGRLVPASDPDLAARGLFDRAASLARYAATRGGRPDLVDHHAAARAAAGAPERPATPAAPLTPSDDTPSAPEDRQGPASAPLTTGPDRTAVKGAILAAENAKTKIEIALRRDLRLLRADVGRESQGLGARLQDHLQRVIDQLAARLVAVPDPTERARLLRPELRRVDRAFLAGLVAALRALKTDPTAPRN